MTIGNACDGAAEQLECEGGGGKCVTLTDGYYIESIACVIIGFVWLAWGWKTVNKLQVYRNN